MGKPTLGDLERLLSSQDVLISLWKRVSELSQANDDLVVENLDLQRKVDELEQWKKDGKPHRPTPFTSYLDCFEAVLNGATLSDAAKPFRFSGPWAKSAICRCVRVLPRLLDSPRAWGYASESGRITVRAVRSNKDFWLTMINEYREKELSNG